MDISIYIQLFSTFPDPYCTTNTHKGTWIGHMKLKQWCIAFCNLNSILTLHSATPLPPFSPSPPFLPIPQLSFLIKYDPHDAWTYILIYTWYSCKLTLIYCKFYQCIGLSAFRLVEESGGGGGRGRIVMRVEPEESTRQGVFGVLEILYKSI